LSCERFCEGWAGLGCPLSPTREECVVACLDKRCADKHAAMVQCAFRGAGTCGFDGRPVPSNCFNEYLSAGNCTQSFGQPQPFRYIPIVLVDDAGRDAQEVGDGG